MTIYDTREGQRLRLNDKQIGDWNRWGPYLSERAWGTVREDYSTGGNAWDSFPHDHARSRVYRWNEDGLGGISDRDQFLCFALALWNGRDPILKERMFGLTNSQGNHGEDVKEYYSYLDNTPSHAYMRYRYKYPQAEYPYEQLIRENAARSKFEMEYELDDTGVFDENRYFDVDIEYAKHAADDLLIRIEISNRGPDPAAITALPTLWFRNTWSWGRDDRRPKLSKLNSRSATDVATILADHWQLGRYALSALEADDLLFTENETNALRLFGVASRTPYVKDALHAYIVEARSDAVNPAGTGTKAAALYRRTVPAGGSATILLRLAAYDNTPLANPFDDVAACFALRREEADEFYAAVIPSEISAEATSVARQAFAGVLWSKQFYHYVVDEWLDGDPGQPPPPTERHNGRNRNWQHLYSRDVIAMPDTWEFPWFASWDLAFHCIVLAYVDPSTAKQLLLLMFREWYMKEDGQVPAYEWAFGDVDPPVLCIAALQVYRIDRERNGNTDDAFLEEMFHKLLLTFTWWTNREDASGKNIFQGGFLGLDNIGPFDRNALPPGYSLGQTDGTAWMAAFAKSLFEIAMTLAERDHAYEGIATKFWEHFFTIANAMNRSHDPAHSLWDEQDGFFYDRLSFPDGHKERVRARTLLGFVPLFESVPLEAHVFDQFPSFKRRRDWLMQNRPELFDTVKMIAQPMREGRTLMTIVRTEQLHRILAYMLDEGEFLSPYGVRSVSRYHSEHPYVISLGDHDAQLDYEPGESTTQAFGGNSNWRGPIWMPMNYLLIRALDQFDRYYGDGLTVECPTGSGQRKDLHGVAIDLARRLTTIFLRDTTGRRPVNGPYERFDRDPHWRDLIPFHEYFHGDSGRGCGASHQTGWTALIAPLLIEYGAMCAPAAQPNGGA